MRPAGQRGNKPLLPGKALKESGGGPEGFPRETHLPAVLRGKISPQPCCFWLKRATALARSLARFPEISGREFRSCRLLSSFLDDAGFRVTRGLPGLPSAFTAEPVRGTSVGPRVCLVVEYDALPGLGHACGHNLNAAMSLLAAALLAPMVQATGGSLLVAGTPDEERMGAKSIMIRQGVFTNVGLALLLHAGAWKNRLRYRTSAFRSLLLGREQQEEAPEEVLRRLKRDLRNRETAVFRTGTDRTPLRLDITAPSGERRDFLSNRAMELLTQTGRPFQLDAGEEPLEPFLVNEPAAGKLAAIWREMGIPFEEAPAWAGSSDMGNLSRCCPTHQAILAVTDRPLAWHTSTFADALSATDMSPAILRGALSLAGMALLFWQDGSFRRETAKAFLAGKICHSPP